jgi:hypothetical protein
MILTFFIYWVIVITTLLILHKRLDAKFKKELEEEEIQ